MMKRIWAMILVVCLVNMSLYATVQVWSDEDGESEVGGEWGPIEIPGDWRMLASDSFDVTEKTAIANYNGGTGFTTGYSADLACTDQTDATYLAQVSATAKQTVPEIAAGGYFARSTRAGAIKTYRRMSTPINMTADAEYYITFDFYSYYDGYGTHQRLGFVDSANESNQVNLGSDSMTSVRKMAATYMTKPWTYFNTNTGVISPSPTTLFQYSGKYTVVAHISARASAQDVLRMRVYYQDPNGEALDEQPSFTPTQWDTVQRVNLSVANLDTFSFQSAIGSGGNYVSQFDNLGVYKGSAVKVTSDKDSVEAGLVKGRTLTLSPIPETNAIGNSQTLESVKWLNNTTGELIAEGENACVIPNDMTNNLMGAQVVVKDTVTESLTTYYPINEYVRPDLDLLALYYASSQGRDTANPANLSAFSPVLLRADVARNNSDFKTGNVYLSVEHYNEADELVDTYKTAGTKFSNPASDLKVTDLPTTGSKKMMAGVGERIRDGEWDGNNNAYFQLKYEPGDYFISRAYYAADPVGAPDVQIDLPLAPGLTAPQFIVTRMNVPGGKLLKLPARWRSSLYPEDWTPEYKDAKGRYLHDFSYAGYQRGEVSPPDYSPGLIYNVVTDFQADPTGGANATTAIQNAINAAQTAGGGTVYLPEGTYKLSRTEGKNYCLQISKSNVSLKGDGSDKTRLYVDDTYARDLNVIHFHGTAWYYPVGGTEKTILGDILAADSTVVPVADISGYNVGDWIVVGLQRKVTPEFAADVGEPSWAPESGTAGVDSIAFLRQITALDADANTISLDAPTLHDLTARDKMRVYKIAVPTTEIGISDLAIGMNENNKRNSDDGKPIPSVGKAWGENDHDGRNEKDTKGYECHNSYAIFFEGCVNGWVNNVDTYAPKGNARGTNLASNFLWVHQSRGVTIQNCDIKNTNYQGGAGNGYAFSCGGNNNLYLNNTTENVRHGYSFRQMATSGNVIYGCSSKNNLYVDDYHQHYSPSNLVDSHEMNGIGWDAQYRAYGTIKHGQVSTQSVFWNCQGGNVVTKQWGYGYAIGCGSVSSALSLGDKTVPIDWIEGTGQGAGLVPQSLYKDQLNRRLGTNKVVLQSMDLTDADNIKLTGTGLNDGLIIVKTVINYNKSVGVPLVAAALFKKTDDLLADIRTSSTPQDDYLYTVGDFNLTGKNPADYYLKIFVWSDKNAMEPLHDYPVIFSDTGRVQ